jgi:16S rRNA G1207 methylase RsmC
VGHEGEHYFTAVPSGPARRRPLRVRLAGAVRELETAGGLFSPDRLDAGTAVLLATAPPPPATGHLLDAGCGWGALALTMALHSPGAVVWAVDVNTRALEVTAANAERLGLGGVRAVLPEQVPDDVELAAMWSNPPVRVGKAALHELLLRWLPRLAPGAEAHLVVHRQLGSDSLQRWLAEQALPPLGGAGVGARVERVDSVRGYRVLRVRRGAPA